MSLLGFLDRIADVPTFDKAIDPARRAVLAALRPQAVKDFLHGTWLGHPLHPVLVQLPVGSWLSAGLLDDLPEGRPTLRSGTAGSAPVPLAVVRRGVGVDVFIGPCSHLSGPLYEGTVEEVRGTSCLGCPWLGSAFALDDGEPRRGPAANALEKLEVRMDAGHVLARLPARLQLSRPIRLRRLV